MKSMLGDVCRKCDNGYYPNMHRNVCDLITPTSMHYTSGPAIGTSVPNTYTN